MDSSVVEDELACSNLPTGVVMCISTGESTDLGDSASRSIRALSLDLAGAEGSAICLSPEIVRPNVSSTAASSLRTRVFKSCTSSAFVARRGC